MLLAYLLRQYCTSIKRVPSDERAVLVACAGVVHLVDDGAPVDRRVSCAQRGARHVRLRARRLARGQSPHRARPPARRRHRSLRRLRRDH